MDALDAITTRRSVTKLIDPGPTAIQLETILNAAVHAPDHKQLSPWRFLIIDGEARKAFGEVMANAMSARDPKASEGQLEKERNKPLRAPTIVAVSVPRVETKIPFSELVAATCAAVQNILLAAHALGLGAIWKTGPAATDPNVKAKLGIDPADEVVGFVYLGQPAEPPAPRHPTTEGVVAVWSP